MKPINIFTAPTVLRWGLSGYSFWQRRSTEPMSHFPRVKYPGVKLATHFRLAPGKESVEQKGQYPVYCKASRLGDYFNEALKSVSSENLKDV